MGRSKKDNKQNFIQFSIRIPENDTLIKDFLEHQTNKGFSIRYILNMFIKKYGVIDIMGDIVEKHITQDISELAGINNNCEKNNVKQNSAETEQKQSNTINKQSEIITKEEKETKVATEITSANKEETNENVKISEKSQPDALNNNNNDDKLVDEFSNIF